MKFLIFNLVLFSILSVSSEDNKQKNLSDYLGKYTTNVQEFEKQMQLVYQDKDKMLPELKNYFSLLKISSDAYVGYEEEKKIDKAELSIRNKKYADSSKEAEKLLDKLTSEYGFAVFILLDNINSIQKKLPANKSKEISNITITNAFEKIKKRQIALFDGWSPVFDATCVKNQNMFDDKCLKPFINSCSKTFSSKNEVLSNTYLNDSFETQSKEINDYTELFSENDSSKVVELFKIPASTYYYGCKYISLLGYDFESQKKLYPSNEQETWINNLGYVALYEYEDFKKVCPSDKSNALTTLFRIIDNKLMYEFTIKKAKSAKEGILKCQKFVDQQCRNVMKTNVSFEYSYQTQGCDIRRVTVNDINKDINDWKSNSYVTEAETNAHLLIKNNIEFCEYANGAGYYWNAELAKLDKKLCDKKTKKP